MLDTVIFELVPERRPVNLEIYFNFESLVFSILLTTYPVIEILCVSIF